MKGGPIDESIKNSARTVEDTDVAPKRVDRRILVAGLVAAALVGTGLVVLLSSDDGASVSAELAGTTSEPTQAAALPPRTTVPIRPATTIEPVTAVATTTTTTEAAPPSTDAAPATAPPLEDEPSVVARPTPVEQPAPPPDTPKAPWADSVFTTAGGHLSTDVGCAWDTSAAGLDAFFAARVGPVLGWDYQHVYPLGGNRSLWLFQDTFIDHSNTASTLGKASFAHNAALVQEGNCFRLLHSGTTAKPAPFELGTGTETLKTWFWPMGGELIDGKLHVFWARMRKDSFDPKPPDGLGWHPDATFVATYDPDTMARLDFRMATQPGAAPIYGYTVQSDAEFTYLFANTFEQNMTREGGWFNGPHSGTKMWLGRVPRGRVFDQPEYWTSKGWSQDRRVAEPILQRHWAEFPFQPRLIDGQWVAATAVNGYWGDSFELDVADNPWGPWTTVESRPLQPRGADPKMNTYHAHLMPWRDAQGNLIVSVSNNARDMLRDAWPNPARYRPMVSTSPWRTPPPPPPTTTTTSTLPPSTTSTSTTTTTTTTTTAPATTTTTSPATTTTTAPSTTTTSSTTTTTVPPTTTTRPPATSSSTTSTTTTSTTSSTTPTSEPDAPG
ncbi:hypothetical protein [Ilumatobacter sp.]|uniref:hypothetical protein n=1 Tax=Ilumatobacter sp. TaxID=1967498 RepID=UPI003C74654B